MKTVHLGENIVAKLSGSDVYAKTQYARWQFDLPDGGVIIVREEDHGFPVNTPCAVRPPGGTGGPEVWHYNIEYQKPNGYRNNKTTVFNLHMAAWRQGADTCFSCWNINPPRCIYSDCLDGDQLNRVQDTIREVAQAFMQALQFVAEVSWTVVVALVGVIIWILTTPFRREAFA